MKAKLIAEIKEGTGKDFSGVLEKELLSDLVSFLIDGGDHSKKSARQIILLLALIAKEYSSEEVDDLFMDMNVKDPDFVGDVLAGYMEHMTEKKLMGVLESSLEFIDLKKHRDEVTKVVKLLTPEVCGRSTRRLLTMNGFDIPDNGSTDEAFAKAMKDAKDRQKFDDEMKAFKREIEASRNDPEPIRRYDSDIQKRINDISDAISQIDSMKKEVGTLQSDTIPIIETVDSMQKTLDEIKQSQTTLRNLNQLKAELKAELKERKNKS